MENKLKHLEFIQNTIIRMGSNSFLIKGWTITLVAALFALSAKDANINYALISYVVIPVFWALDGYFLSKERQYRYLFNQVAAKEENQIDFAMHTSSFKAFECTWLAGIISITLVLFYGISVVATIIVMSLFK